MTDRDVVIAAVEKCAEICDKIWEEDAGTEGAGSSATCAIAIRAYAAALRQESGGGA